MKASLSQELSFARLCAAARSAFVVPTVLLFAWACAAGDSVMSDTWVATDGLGRTLPTFEEVGGPRTNRTVILFYFLTLGQHNDCGPFDVSKILANDPAAVTKNTCPPWGPLYAPHFWAEPLFGYYNSTDKAVIRKHAQMLADAGVDAIAFDLSNGFDYPEARRAVFEAFSEVRAAGGETPQIVFWLPFYWEARKSRNTNMRYELIRLWRDVYKANYHPELWFRWQGKPLIVCHPSYADPGYEEGLKMGVRAAPIPAAGGPEEAREIRAFFTFRKPFPTGHGLPKTHDRSGHWTWRQIFPQGVALDPDGKAEEISVSVSQNFNATRTIAASEPDCFTRAHQNGADDPTPENLARGLNFQEQWERALKVDPRVIFVTGWNEWTAGRYREWEGSTTAAVFPDNFDAAHSRDAEPVKGFWGDAYYWQLVSNIRRYKGVREIEPVRSRPILIDGSFEDWREVGPAFRDTPGDPVKRHAKLLGKAGRVDDDSGRNDIVEAKVSVDAGRICFYVRTADSLVHGEAGNWMLLFVDADADAKTGWLGYDLTIRPAAPQKDVSVSIGACEIELSVPLERFGGKLPRHMDFKWADNCLEKNDWSDFTLHGDAAPNDRHNFRARFR